MSLTRGSDFYLNAAGRAPLLTAVQEIELARQFREWRDHPDYPNTDQRLKRRALRARDRMIQSNMRLVVSIAKRYLRRLQECSTYEFPDLIQDGNMGLMTAVEKFDPERGYKFSTYSYWWIRQSIHRGLETRERLIRAPHTVAEQLMRVSRVTQQLSATLGRMPTADELADGLKMTKEEFLYMMQIQAKPKRLDMLASGNSDSNLIDLIADDRSDDLMVGVETQLRLDQFRQAWDYLKPEEQDLVSRRYGMHGHHPHTYKELTALMGICGERARQKVRQVEHKLRLLTGAKQPVQPRTGPRRHWATSAAS